MTLKTEEISRTHNRRNFDCGTSPLNEFLAQVARQSSDKLATRTFVLVDDESDPSDVRGYFTLVPSTIEFPDNHPLKKKFPEDPPVVRLARLAVDNSEQGQGLGEFLLIEALERIAHASYSVGGIGCVVDAKTERAKRFYEKYGFVEIDNEDSDSLALWLPMDQCLAVLDLANAE